MLESIYEVQASCIELNSELQRDKALIALDHGRLEPIEDRLRTILAKLELTKECPEQAALRSWATSTLDKIHTYTHEYQTWSDNHSNSWAITRLASQALGRKPSLKLDDLSLHTQSSIQLFRIHGQQYVTAPDPALASERNRTDLRQETEDFWDSVRSFGIHEIVHLHDWVAVGDQNEQRYWGARFHAQTWTFDDVECREAYRGTNYVVLLKPADTVEALEVVRSEGGLPTFARKIELVLLYTDEGDRRGERTLNLDIDPHPVTVYRYEDFQSMRVDEDDHIRQDPDGMAAILGATRRPTGPLMVQCSDGLGSTSAFIQMHSLMARGNEPTLDDRAETADMIAEEYRAEARPNHHQQAFADVVLDKIWDEHGGVGGSGA